MDTKGKNKPCLDHVSKTEDPQLLGEGLTAAFITDRWMDSRMHLGREKEGTVGKHGALGSELRFLA